MEPLTPAVASALRQLGPRGGGRATGCSLGSLSLGSARGLTEINPSCPKEKSVLRKAYLPSPLPIPTFLHIPRHKVMFKLTWLGSGWQSPLDFRLRLGQSKVAGSGHLFSHRNLSSNALESLSWKTVQGLSLQDL